MTFRLFIILNIILGLHLCFQLFSDFLSTCCLVSRDIFLKLGMFFPFFQDFVFCLSLSSSNFRTKTEKKVQELTGDWKSPIKETKIVYRSID